MKNQALFSSKDKSKKLNCRLLQFLFGALRVKRGCIEDNSKTIFLISQNICCDPSLEPSLKMSHKMFLSRNMANYP